MQPIPHSRPWLTEGDSEAIRETLRSGMIGQGERVCAFERRFSEWVGGAGGVAVGSGAAALHLALLGSGIGHGDAVILPSYVCQSVLDAVRALNAEPVLADVWEDWVITPGQVQPLLTARTKAVIVPHMYGLFAPVAAFRSMGLTIIEDCAQAIGAYGQAPVAGDLAIFSFQPTKCLTTGEGGMVVGRDGGTVERLRTLRDEGRDGHARRMAFSPMSDLAAALGLSQLHRYPESLERRRRVAARYVDALAPSLGSELRLPVLERGMFFRFPVCMPGGVDAYAARFTEQGITVRKGVDRLLHREVGISDAGFPHSVRLFEQTVSLPIYPALSEEEIVRCVDTARRVFESTP